jgi:hypothetical protein
LKYLVPSDLISIFIGTLYSIFSKPKKKTFAYKATAANQERLRLESFKRMKRESARKIHESVGPTQESEATSVDQHHPNLRIRREKEETANQLLTKTMRENNNEEDIEADILQHNFLTHFQHLPFPQHFPFVIKLPKRYYLKKGCIIDLETTSFSSLSGHIITMGILEKDRATVHQLTVPNYKDFQVYCFQKAREAQEPRYSYNARFESEFLQIETGWRDLMQYRVVDRFPVCARGLEIAKSKESQIRQIDNFNYQVHSQDSDRWYAVNLSGDEWNWSCECSFYSTFFEKCKHIWAVEFGFKGLNMEQVKKNDLFSKYRKSLGQCTSPTFEEPAIRGADVPQIWQQWLNTNKPQILANITLHCLSDLLRERQLVKE